MKPLKIINENHQDYTKLVLSSNIYSINNYLDHNNFWFLHGELEKITGNDKAIIYNILEFPELTKESVICADCKMINGARIITSDFIISKSSFINSILPVEIYGMDKKCIGYFWTTDEKLRLIIKETTGEKRKFLDWKQRGLVCLKDDKKACEYALKCYTERKQQL